MSTRSTTYANTPYYDVTSDLVDSTYSYCQSLLPTPTLSYLLCILLSYWVYIMYIYRRDNTRYIIIYNIYLSEEAYKHNNYYFYQYIQEQTSQSLRFWIFAFWIFATFVITIISVYY